MFPYRHPSKTMERPRPSLWVSSLPLTELNRRTQKCFLQGAWKYLYKAVLTPPISPYDWLSHRASSVPLASDWSRRGHVRGPARGTTGKNLLPCKDRSASRLSFPFPPGLCQWGVVFGVISVTWKQNRMPREQQFCHLDPCCEWKTEVIKPGSLWKWKVASLEEWSHSMPLF